MNTIYIFIILSILFTVLLFYCYVKLFKYISEEQKEYVFAISILSAMMGVFICIYLMYLLEGAKCISF